MKKCSTRSCYK